jgi:hypothetical protein
MMLNIMSRARREKNVVMFHVGRSGSTVLGDLFNQNQSIFWDSEIFMHNRMPVITKPLSKLIFSFPALIVRVRRTRTRKPIYGFEAKLAQVARTGLSLPQFITAMKNLEFEHFILLRRRNHLRVIISDLVAKQQGYWHQKAQGSLVSSAPLQVEVDVNLIKMGVSSKRAQLPLLEHLHAAEEDFSQLNLLLEGQAVLNLVYEDHIERDPTDAYRQVCNFLNIMPAEVKVQLRKTNPRPVRELVSNYAELANALAGSPYEWMLKG